jgi:hypothetical protein
VINTDVALGVALRHGGVKLSCRAVCGGGGGSWPNALV